MKGTKENTAADAAAPAILENASGISWRSVTLGILGVFLTAILGPWNDYALANTLIVGSYFPPVMALSMFFLAVMVNGILLRFAPRKALTSAELGVITAMLLVGCVIPGQGLMRELMPLLVVPYRQGATDLTFWNAFRTLALPEWLFAPQDMSASATNSQVVTWFYSRAPEGEAIPWRNWVLPMAAWGLFFAALFATLLAMADILRRQWAVNERLPFPLAQLGLSLVEPPTPGHSLNRLFSARTFWVSTSVVFFIHSLAALDLYYPALIPEIPLQWNLSGVLANPPLQYLHWLVKTGTIYFTFIGITFFIRSSVAFSLWAIFLIEQLISMNVQSYGEVIPEGAWRDQHLGASFAFVLGALWIGRHHWSLVIRQAIRGPRPGEPRGECLSSRASVIIILLGVSTMVAWLAILQVSWNMILVILAFIFIGHILIARIVAETGLPFMRFFAGIPQLYAWTPTSWFSGRDILFAGAFTLTGPIATRESLLTFATQGLSVSHAATGDSTIADEAPRQTRGRTLLSLLALVLVVSFVVSAASALWTYYSYASPLASTAPQTILNPAAADTWPRAYMNDPLVQHSRGRFSPSPHSPLLHLGIGAGITTFLQIASWRWVSWPLMPVGYVVTGTWYIQAAWFSIFLGWLAKTLVLKFGGASLFQTTKPVFVGLIFGEALAAGFWLLVNVLLAMNGYDYRPVNVLPI